MSPFTFNTTRSIQFGAGSIARLGDLARATMGTRVLAITDPGMMRTGIVERALDILNAAGVKTALFDKVEADPPEAVIHAATDMARSAGAEGITDRCKPSHVLMTYDAFERLTGRHHSLVEALSMPGLADIEFSSHRIEIAPRAVDLS